MTPRSERIILDRAADRIDKSRPIDPETLSGLQEILLTSRKELAEEISLLMSLIGYRRAGYRASKSTDERETAYTMGIVVGMQKMVEAYDARVRNTCEEIVRCRDCKYAKHYRPFVFGKRASVEEWYCEWHSNPEGASEIKPDGFCAWGERKDKQKNS